MKRRLRCFNVSNAPFEEMAQQTIQQWKSKRGKHVKKNVPEKFPAGIWQPFDGGPLNCNLI